ncbi:MAG TPA: hypothetical protein VGM33_04305 [Baekduia sp.]|jgi:hypothetical protein
MKMSHQLRHGDTARRLRTAAATLAVASAALLGAAGAAEADFGIPAGGATVTLTDASGNPQPQAGAHPDLNVNVALNTEAGRYGTEPAESLKDLSVELPPGLLGDPQALPTCSNADFQHNTCDRRAMVGVEAFDWSALAGLPPAPANVPVFNLEPPKGVAAQLGFQVTTVSVIIDVRVESDGTYNIAADVSGISSVLQVYATNLTLWGVPADHNGEGPNPFYAGGIPPITSYGAPGPGPRTAFIDSPTRCGAPLGASVRIDSWQHPGAFVTANPDVSAGLTGCDALSFQPSISVQPSTRVAGAPAGYTVDVDVPQTLTDADGLATPHLKDATVVLPPGVNISPSAATGLGACSDAQLAMSSIDADTCPPSATIGTVRIDTPVLPDPLVGKIYLGTQESSDPASGKMYRMFVTASGHGVRVKLRGAISADPATGQLTTTFADNPQLPFSRLELVLQDGDRAPLVNPTVCGTQTATGSLTSWAGQTAAVSSTFAIDQGCPTGRFAPSATAGTLIPVAGAFSPFTTTVARSDADQELSRVRVDLPPGLLGDVGSVPLCPDAAAAAGTCDPSSRLGSTTVQAGSGAAPFTLGGTVSLAGPYEGAPFSLSIAVPAKAGPIDLGLVVVRAPLKVDGTHAQASAISDPLPTIVGGVPLKLRSVTVTLDRPGFTFNPTDCNAAQVGVHADSVAGLSSDTAVPFGLTGCDRLGYTPRLSLGLTGKGQTTDDKHPALAAHLTTLRADANTQAVSVTLPLSLALDPDNANGLCEPADAAAARCPAASVVGHAAAVTPILGHPLAGPVYFVRGERIDPKSGRTIKTLPKLYVPLSGADGIEVDLHADSEVQDDHLVTTFAAVPDAPVADFTLNIDGGAHGILVVSNADLCQGEQVAAARFTGQNGKVRETSAAMATPCRLAVVGSGHGRTALHLKVGGLGAGRVSVTGRGVVKAARTIRSATVATVSPRLTAATRRSLARHRNVKVAVTVTFTPQGSRKSTRTVKHLIVHGAGTRKGAGA